MDIGGFLQTVNSGGPAMWMLLVLSVVAIAIVIERLLFISSQHSDSKGLLRSLGQKIAANDLSGAIKVCQQNKGMLPKILAFGLERGEKNRADITDALSIALMAVTIYVILWIASRIYRVGVLMYGKRPSLPEILRWLKYS